MKEAARARLARAETELEAARLLREGGFPDQATSRAYYAAFFAAEAALLTLGETRSKHAGVIAAFGRLVVKQGAFDRERGADLRRLFELRNAADYAWLDEQDVGDDDPITLAERFVAGVASWILARTR